MTTSRKETLIRKLLLGLFDSLQKQRVKYSVMNLYESLPDIVKTDVVIAIEKSGFYTIDKIGSSR